MGACGVWMGVEVEIGGDEGKRMTELMWGKHVSVPKDRG